MRTSRRTNPEFDPANLKYSCVHYIPYTHENAEGITWVDPMTGEILNAGIFIYNNVTWALNNWRVLQTAQLDPSVRTKKMPDDIMGESRNTWLLTRWDIVWD